jgi:hypothetical protein
MPKLSDLKVTRLARCNGNADRRFSASSEYHTIEAEREPEQKLFH